MVTTRCIVCRNEALLTFVNDGLNRSLTAKGIAASLEAAGGKMDPDVISRHKRNHWTPPVDPDAPKPTKRDLAIMLRDKVADAIENKDGDTLLVLGKEYAPMVGAGLRAQAMLDKREATDKKLGLAAGALGFQMYLAGLGRTDDPLAELDDGNTIEGDFTPIDPEVEALRG